MRAGSLRHRVTIEGLVTDQDSDGATVDAWVPVFDGPISAAILPMSGRELIAAQAVQSKLSVRIKVRYRAGFKPTQRAVHRGTYYSIEAVVSDNESGFDWLTLMCSSGVNEG